MHNLKLIGTSHIARQSIEEIEKGFKEYEPDIVALELDPKRFVALTTKQKRGIPNIRRIGVKGLLFSLVGQYVQQKLGQKVGVAPGSEMITAIQLAREHKTRIELIDQDIEITLQRFSKMLTWKEKFRILGDVIRGMFGKGDTELQGIRKIDLSKVPDKKVIKMLLAEVKKRYPGIYLVLVEERNHVMAMRLARLLDKNPEKKIMAIVGAGHEDELLKLIARYRAQTGHSFSYSTSFESA